jgi:hypothetical protein
MFDWLTLVSRPRLMLSELCNGPKIIAAEKLDCLL